MWGFYGEYDQSFSLQILVQQTRSPQSPAEVSLCQETQWQAEAISE